MRLKKLVLHGFKSFADRTEFRFDAAITGVVGPNGCGKSNVVDAIKWVLGEQSAKSLRGGAMLDVIFNGADARKPAGFAEVELVFENPRRPDGTRLLLIDSDDVSIVRRLYRDGTSEYQINKLASRLKDIKEAFLDTGVGVDAYSIIEQGRVARLLEANPIERRQIFEEAAGISRFKVRRKEAQRKLEQVDENLARLKDITDELDRRLRGVRAQAGRARVYQEHATRLAELRLRHALHEYHTLSTRRADLTTREEDARFRLDDADGSLRAAQNELALQREAAEAIGQARQHAGHELVETKSKVEQAAQQVEYARRQLQQLAEQSVQLASDRETAEARLHEVQQVIDEANVAVESLTQSVAEQRVAIDERMADHRAAQQRANEVNAVAEQHKVAHLDAMRKLSAIDARLGSVDVLTKNQALQQQRLAERLATLDGERDATSVKRTDALAAIDEASGRVTALQRQVEERTAQASDLGAALKDLTQRIGGAREHRSGLTSRQKTLQEMENRREGMSDAVKHVLKNRATFTALRGVVADLLRVDVEHAKVIEAALDGRDQWLVAQPSTELDAVQEQLQGLAGRVNVLRLSPALHAPPVDRAEIEDTLAEREVVWQPLPVLASEPAAIELDSANSLREQMNVTAIGAAPACRGIDVAPQIYRMVAQLSDTLSSGAVEGSAAPQLFNETPIAADGQPFSDSEYVDLTEEKVERIVALMKGEVAYDWGRHAQPARAAIDLVRFAPDDRELAEHLLGKTAVVGSLADGIALHREGPHGWRYVTPAGDVIEADGTLRTGPLGAAMGILSRRSELEALAGQIAELDVRIDRFTRELSDGNDQARSLDGALSALRQEIYTLNTAKVELNMQAQQAQQRLDAIGREQPVIQREIDNLAAGVARLAAEAQTLAADRQAHAADQQERQRQIDQLADEQRAIADQQRQSAEALTSMRVTLGQLEEKVVHAQQRLRQAETQQQQFEEQIDRIAKNIDALEGRRDATHNDQRNAEHQQDVLRARANDISSHLAELDSQITVAQAALKDLARAVESSRAERVDLEQALHKLQIDLSETGVRLESVVGRVREELQIEIAERYQAIIAAQQVAAQLVDADAASTLAIAGDEVSPASDDPSVGQALPDAAMDWDAIAAEIRTLREKIQRLGNVNLDSIAELDELEKRQGDYAAQLADLASSKQQLEDLIEKLNAESGVRFEETFRAVRENFQQMFRKLFGGGKADIILETELIDRQAVLPAGADPTAGPIMRRIDPLDAGIEVIARPPGKHPVALSQLSGGEKAMTCIALLMSIFKAKPSPFCILDEVDAPLDEANNVRFGQIVQEFLATSQFIIITHHKRTMQIADTLYGITQQTQGVSTRVQVKFEQVDSDGRVKGGAALLEAEEVAA